MHKVEIHQDQSSRGLWIRNTWLVERLTSLFATHPIMQMILSRGRLRVKLFEGWVSLGGVIGTSRISLMLNCELVSMADRNLDSVDVDSEKIKVFEGYRGHVHPRGAAANDPD